MSRMYVQGVLDFDDDVAGALGQLLEHQRRRQLQLGQSFRHEVNAIYEVLNIVSRDALVLKLLQCCSEGPPHIFHDTMRLANTGFPSSIASSLVEWSQLLHVEEQSLSYWRSSESVLHLHLAWFHILI